MKKDILIPLIAGSLIFAIALISGFVISAKFDDPSSCNSCHEMKIYYDSYTNPQNGSIIKTHDLNCIQCHTRKYAFDTKMKIGAEIIVYTLNLSGPFIPKLILKPECTKCHSILNSNIHKKIKTSECTYCHAAHIIKERLNTKNISLLSSIPYGFHNNQTCSNCHGTTFQIPLCTKCHAGHGEQKLENKLCLACHSDPHTPIKPGTLYNNTVIFTGNLPFSVCKPCHETEYYEIINSFSMHTEMQTCTLCHTSHGKKPKCQLCHNKHIKRHFDFECKLCHGRQAGIPPCQNCHGITHEWSRFSTTLNTS